MKLEITRSGKPLAEYDVVELEKRVGSALPTPYRQFLLEHNGGRVYPDCFDFSRDGEEDGSMVDWFLRIDEDEWSDMYHYLDTYKDRVPSGLMPIAHDPGGNLILISLLGDGRIYYWDHEEEAEEGEMPSNDNIYFVADNFSEFLESLSR